VTELGAVIRARLAIWGDVALPLERATFGTTDPDAIAAAVSAWCAEHLGASIDHYEFFDSSSGSVHGVELVDGRRVVVKVHRPSLSTAYLAALARTQLAFADAGWAAPRPLVRVDRITCETMLGPFPKVDGHDPGVRGVLARGLATFVAAADGLDPSDLAHPLDAPSDDLYPPPHSERFDFDATAAGAEWIDELARAAKARRVEAPIVIAHGDWRVDNVRVVDGSMAAIYDWDSVGLLPEVNAVAAAATTFTVDWDQPMGARFPNVDETAAFVAEYEDARGMLLDHDALRTAMIATLAYGARCEHAAGAPHAATDDSFTARLRAVNQIHFLRRK
jgi:Ser/Thr protein kinase RdoA (MazF antagonist)